MQKKRTFNLLLHIFISFLLYKILINYNIVKLNRDIDNQHDYNQETINLVKSLSKTFCRINIKLESGEDCCQVTGIICKLRNDNIITLINSDDNLIYYIPVEKIVSISVPNSCL